MPDATTLLYLYAETPLHAGVGRQIDAAVDLPIQRDQAAYPVVHASSLKGSLRAHAATTRATEEIACVFGSPPEATEADRFPGALVLEEARTLLFPLRSLNGIFAWVTSAAALVRLQRDAEGHGVALSWPPPGGIAEGAALVPPNTGVVGMGARLTLEELTFRAQPNASLAELGHWLAEQVFPADAAFAFWRQKVQRDVALLPENAFRYFVTHSTEVISRIRIDPRTGAAAEGALWTEEALPADTLLYVPVVAKDPSHPTETLKTAADVLRWLQEVTSRPFQIGGSRTLGRGFVRVRWAAASPQGGP